MYQVMLNGRGCRVRLRKKRSLLRRSISEVEVVSGDRQGPFCRSGFREQELGFYTTRWVEGWSPADAAKRARDAVRDELDEYLLNGVEDPITITVEKVEESDPRAARVGPNTGFTWS
jgi:hypothetical protein